MLIKNLSLSNFRNFYKVENIAFPPKSLLVAAAPNATGKTNFLESITLALRGKSFRSGMEQCVRWGENGFNIKVEVDHNGENSEVVVYYQNSPRKFKIEENGAPVSPVTFYSRYPLILFLPDDTFMFARGPAVRRNFFNNILVSSPQYLAALVQYHRCLKQRNTALKNNVSQEGVKVWTDMLAGHAEIIWQYRQSLVDFINQNLNEVYTRLFGENLEFEVGFLPGVTDIDNYVSILAESWPSEQRYGYTLYGPHRDDMEISINSRPIQSVLSRGQTRGVVIALKLAVHGFLKQITGKEPLLLLDEVLSELDDDRQHLLLKNLPSSQILITCTSLPPILKQRQDVKMLDLRSIIDESS